MEISERTLEAVKKVVFTVFDNGKVKDVSMRLGRDTLGIDCVRVRLYVVPGKGPEDYGNRLFSLPIEISNVLDDDLKDLLPHVEIRTV